MFHLEMEIECVVDNHFIWGNVRLLGVALTNFTHPAIHTQAGIY
jgi:hypothetical protein